MTDQRHELAEAGQVCLGLARVETAEVCPSPAHGHNVLELTVSETPTVPAPVAKTLAERGLSVDVAASGAKPDHIVVVAY